MTTDSPAGTPARRAEGLAGRTAGPAESAVGPAEPAAALAAGHLPVREQLDFLRACLLRNRTLAEVLGRSATLRLPGWYLVAGCVYQTVWNVIGGRPPDEGILDYDLVYFDDSDLSWDAEGAIIRAGRDHFADIAAPVQIRNQARVHLWYGPKFGRPCPAHASSEAAIGTFEATCACVGVRLEPDGRWRVYAPFGLSDILNLVVRPNAVLAPEHVYQAKADRWKRQWPSLTVLPWPACSPADRPAASQGTTAGSNREAQ